MSRALVDRQAAGLFRAHIGSGAKDGTRASSAFRDGRCARDARARAIPRDELGEAEVQNLHDAVGRDFDGGGLQVAVPDSALVSRLERVGALSRDRNGVAKGQVGAPSCQAWGSAA